MSETKARQLTLVSATKTGTPTIEFQRNVAVIIGINDYGHGIPPLHTARADAERLAEILAEQHGYEIILLTDGVSTARITALLADELPQTIGHNDRLLFYFAGHGIALSGTDGPAGYLIPQDGDAADQRTFLPMQVVHDALTALDCRHCLVILDCCFSGAFRWSSMRTMIVPTGTLYRERYERFLRSPAWQLITSASYDQEAIDLLVRRGLGTRDTLTTAKEDQRKTPAHSPFAQALFDALSGNGERCSDANKDGVLVATELYLYLRDHVEVRADREARHRQTPGLWPLQKHDKGEYIFLLGDPKLPPAPELTPENNPYRGLASYNVADAELFFGREILIEQLAALVAVQPLTVVLGASGTGKSSLIKAGVAPFLLAHGEADEASTQWHLLDPLRPTERPMAALAALITEQLAGNAPNPDNLAAATAIESGIADWLAAHPGQKLLLIIDQLEELITLCHDADECLEFQEVLAQLLNRHADQLRIILTLRTDFEPHFAQSPLADRWQQGRVIVPPMGQADLRDVIEGPANVRVLFFEPPALVNTLIDEVLQTPGALPLLSFTLEQLYLKYLKRQEVAQAVGDTIERALTQADYAALGGVIGSLRTRAEAEYQALPDEAHRATMARVMLRMVALEGSELARRRVPRQELIFRSAVENQRVARVIGQLVDARLLVSDGVDANGDGVADAHVEPAHDALVRAWDRLLRWKQQGEEQLILQRSLYSVADEWTEAGQGPKSGLLWNNNPRLPQLAKIIEEPAHWLNDRELTFVESSLHRAQSLQNRNRIITATIMMVLLTATVISFILRQQAVQEASRARSGEIAAIATDLIDEDSELATLLALNAIEEEEFTTNAELALRNAYYGFNLRGRDQLIDTVATGNNATEHSITDVAFDFDGAYYAIGTPSGEILLYGTDDPTVPIQTFSLRSWIRALTFSRGESPIVAAGDIDGHLRIWDPLQATVLFSISIEIPIADITIDPTETFVTAIAGTETSSAISVRRWRIADGTELDPLTTFAANTITYSPDGETLALSGIKENANEVALYTADLTTELYRGLASEESEYSPHKGGVLALDYHPSSQLLATVGGDSIIRLWEIGNSGKLSLSRKFFYHDEALWAVRFAQSGDCLIAAGIDQRASIWRTDGRLLGTLTGSSSYIRGANFLYTTSDQYFGCPNEYMTVESQGGLLQGRLRLEEFVSINAHTKPIEDLLYSPDGKFLISAGHEGTVAIYTTDNYAERARLPHSGLIRAIDISTDSQALIVADEAGEVSLWSLETFQRLSRFSITGDPLIDVRFHPQEAGQIIVANSNGYLQVVDPMQQQIVAEKWVANQPQAIDFTADGQYIFMSGDEYLLRQDADFDQDLIGLLQLERSTIIYRVRYMAEDKQLIAVDSLGRLSVGSIAGEQPEWKTYQAHSGPLFGLATNSGGSLLATAGNDRQTKIWDRATMRLVKELPMAEETINMVAFSPDDRRIATAGEDGMIRIYYTNVEELLDKVKTRLLRSLTEAECTTYELTC